MLLQEKLIDKKIFLASQSPRRQELLKRLGIDFVVVKIESDESFPEELNREEITEFISENKANACGELNPGEILITADTLVWLNNRVFGKPQDAQEAFDMIAEMSDATHEVFTSVTLKSNEKILTFSETTEVTFDKFSEEEINFYIEHFKPFDKAGAYGIQDWLGYAKISRINGCYYNVMGLPLHHLYKVLLLEEF